MKKNVYLMAALIGMGSIVWSSCSDDEKIVEVEKIVEKVVVEQDMTKIPEAVREGLKGNPKTVELSIASGVTVDEATGAITPKGWSNRSVIAYNEAGYRTKEEAYEVFYTAIEKDMPDDPNDTYYKLTTLELKLTATTDITLGADNRLTKIVQQESSFSTYIKNAAGDEGWVYASSDPFDINDYEVENPTIVIQKLISSTQITTTIDITTKKATIITQSKYNEGDAWEDSKKEVADLDEYGYPNMNSKEDYDVAQELPSKAFEKDPSAKYIEKLDEKGNWIVRYKLEFGAVSNYQERDIVYY